MAGWMKLETHIVTSRDEVKTLQKRPKEETIKSDQHVVGD